MKSQYEYLNYELISKTVTGREIKTQNGGDVIHQFCLENLELPWSPCESLLINVQLVSRNCHSL